jgi:hypothetical protein
MLVIHLLWIHQPCVNGKKSLRRLQDAPSNSVSGTHSFALISPYSTMSPTGRSIPWSNTGSGARRICRNGLAMAAFEYRQAEEIRDVFERFGVQYLFIGKSGAILLGFPDTTQDADLFVEKTASNCGKIGPALEESGFRLTEPQNDDMRRGKDFVQLKNGPFDLDLIFAPDGIETFEDAWGRRVDVRGFHVCSIDDIVRS